MVRPGGGAPRLHQRDIATVAEVIGTYKKD